MIQRLALGFVLSLLIGWVGYWRGSLSRSGVIGAMLVGTAMFGFGGLSWGVLLMAFFVSSSLLSKFRHHHKDALADRFSKGSQRDIGQALANGGAGALLAVAHALAPEPAILAAFVGAMATVNADTWATELGVLASSTPRLITNGRSVEVGTSGGVSWGGTGAALAGSAFISAIAAVLVVFAGRPEWSLPLLFLGGVSGLFGSLVDSLLGATVQSIYWCDLCGKETERHPLHRCGNPTRPLRGWRWLDNDWVNLLSSFAGAALAAMLWALTSTPR